MRAGPIPAASSPVAWAAPLATGGVPRHHPRILSADQPRDPRHYARAIARRRRGGATRRKAQPRQYRARNSRRSFTQRSSFSARRCFSETRVGYVAVFCAVAVAAFGARSNDVKEIEQDDHRDRNSDHPEQNSTHRTSPAFRSFHRRLASIRDRPITDRPVTDSHRRAGRGSRSRREDPDEAGRRNGRQVPARQRYREAAAH